MDANDKSDSFDLSSLEALLPCNSRESGEDVYWYTHFRLYSKGSPLYDNQVRGERLLQLTTKSTRLNKRCLGNNRAPSSGIPHPLVGPVLHILRWNNTTSRRSLWIPNLKTHLANPRHANPTANWVQRHSHGQDLSAQNIISYSKNKFTFTILVRVVNIHSLTLGSQYYSRCTRSQATKQSIL
jgi:hypothetical protein